MQKAVRQLTAVLGRVILIGFSVQIVLGTLWICFNFAKLQEFGEYTGNLYPVLVLLTKGAEKMFRLPYYCVLYALQLCAAYLAAHTFLKKIGKTDRLQNVWGSLALVTLPMNLQCHLAVLPNSFATSLLLLEIAYVLEGIQGAEICGKISAAVKPGVCWLLSAFLMPEYFYFGAVPILFYLICHAVQIARGRKRQSRKPFFCQLAALFLLAGVIFGANSLATNTGYGAEYGNGSKTGCIEANIVSRFGWTSILEYTESWQPELLAVFDLETLRNCGYHAENMQKVFVPIAVETVGEERAKEFFLEVAKTAWARNGVRIRHEITWDMVGYTLSPVVLQLHLERRGYDAYSGRNYEIMRYHAPRLTGAYMNYGCWWFAAGIGVSAVLLLLRLTQGNGRKALFNSKTVLSALLICLCSGSLILWYTMQGAGMMDYKNTIAVNFFWALFALCVMPQLRENE